jgi:type II protein arginine methyltransferase
LSDDLERWIAAAVESIRGKPDYAFNLIGIAEIVAAKEHKLRAYKLARDAMALADGDPLTTAVARRLLASLLPGYHVGMMNDARRNEAWDKALRRAIEPGMLVLEIGTGAGMLALMAARAGAQVVTCEFHGVAAQMAREIAARNGYADKIKVVTKRSQQLVMGHDLERPADLLISDIFADSLLDFDPLPALSDARRRLMAPGAPTIPAAGSLFLAPANWKEFARLGHIDAAAGFDLKPFAGFVPTVHTLRIDNPSLQLMAQPREAFRFDFSAPTHPQSARKEFAFEAETDGEVNAVMRWIKLELDDETVLEARPEAGAIFFSGCVAAPLEAALQVRAGDSLRVGASYNGAGVETWLAES